MLLSIDISSLRARAQIELNRSQ